MATFTIKLSPRFINGKLSERKCIHELYSWFCTYAHNLKCISKTPFELVNSSIELNDQLWFEFKYTGQEMDDTYRQVCHLYDPDCEGVNLVNGCLVTSDWLNRQELLDFLCTHM